MSKASIDNQALYRLLRRGSTAALAALCLLLTSTAQALPIFARQTGQSCVACHAGGQFPELTPY
ncbi:cytochrome C, partial [Paraburkholderia dipogonis]